MRFIKSITMNDYHLALYATGQNYSVYYVFGNKNDEITRSASEVFTDFYAASNYFDVAYETAKVFRERADKIL